MTPEEMIQYIQKDLHETREEIRGIHQHYRTVIDTYQKLQLMINKFMELREAKFLKANFDLIDENRKVLKEIWNSLSIDRSNIWQIEKRLGVIERRIIKDTKKTKKEKIKNV